jgi:predicted metal-binding protein
MSEQIHPDGEALRTCKAPWKGTLVLACRKCQKKLKGDGEKNNLAKIGKKMAKMAHREGLELQVVGVPCLNLCPKGGVTVCTAGQAARNQCSIVRSKRDLRELVEQCKRPL